MSSIDSLLEQLINIKNINLSTNEYLNLHKKHENKQILVFFNIINSCFQKYSQESKLKGTSFNHSLFFQCSASNICSLSFKETINCIQTKKQSQSKEKHTQNEILGCENEYLRFSSCMDSSIEIFTKTISFADEEK